MHSAESDQYGGKLIQKRQNSMPLDSIAASLMKMAFNPKGARNGYWLDCMSGNLLRKWKWFSLEQAFANKNMVKKKRQGR